MPSEKHKRIKAAKKRSTAVSLTIIAILAVAAIGGVWYLLSGLHAGSNEQVGMEIVMHIHPHLVIKINGTESTIPANIGIDQTLWRSHELDKYGMPGMSPLHTHDTSGTLHVESTVNRDYTVGEFFDVWGVTFNENCIFDYCNDGRHMLKMYINGEESHEFRNHILRDKEEIFIEYS